MKVLSAEPPSFSLREASAGREQTRTYYRAEVHLREGGQGYDLMGMSGDEIIHDVLDHYERHLRFVDAVR